MTGNSFTAGVQTRRESTTTENFDYAPAPDRSVSTSAVIAVATELGIDPREMDEPLHDWIDPDALDALVESMEDGHVSFSMAGHRVRVRADGRISVDDVR